MDGGLQKVSKNNAKDNHHHHHLPALPQQQQGNYMSHNNNKNNTTKDHPNKTNSKKNTKRQQRYYCCGCRWFLVVVAFLIAMEAAILMCLVIRSHTLKFVDPFLNEDGPYDFLVWLDTTLGGGSDQEREELAELEAHLVQMAEDHLDLLGYGHDSDNIGFLSLFSSEQEVGDSTSLVALDDYFSRPHHDPDPLPKADAPTVLLVGGLQGSGSRAVVDALSQLDVPMITLDRPMAIIGGSQPQSITDGKTKNNDNCIKNRIFEVSFPVGSILPQHERND